MIALMDYIIEREEIKSAPIAEKQKAKLFSKAKKRFDKRKAKAEREENAYIDKFLSSCKAVK